MLMAVKTSQYMPTIPLLPLTSHVVKFIPLYSTVSTLNPTVVVKCVAVSAPDGSEHVQLECVR